MTSFNRILTYLDYLVRHFMPCNLRRLTPPFIQIPVWRPRRRHAMQRLNANVWVIKTSWIGMCDGGLDGKGILEDIRVPCAGYPRGVSDPTSEACRPSCHHSVPLQDMAGTNFDARLVAHRRLREFQHGHAGIVSRSRILWPNAFNDTQNHSMHHWIFSSDHHP